MIFASPRPAAQSLPATHRLLAGILLWHVAAIVVLAVSPRLHHWIHPDCDDDDHDCAVVLFVHGGCHAAPLAIVQAPALPLDFVPAILVRTTLSWVPSAFSLSRVLEHAPPAAA